MENSVFKDLNLSDARSKNETREEYKLRLKQNRQVMKIYNTVGRENFKQLFPNGILEALKTVEKTSQEEFGEAK